jgi:hypothetical protein
MPAPLPPLLGWMQHKALCGGANLALPSHHAFHPPLPRASRACGGFCRMIASSNTEALTLHRRRLRLLITTSTIHPTTTPTPTTSHPTLPRVQICSWTSTGSLYPQTLAVTERLKQQDVLPEDGQGEEFGGFQVVGATSSVLRCWRTF